MCVVVKCAAGASYRNCVSSSGVLFTTCELHTVLSVLLDMCSHPALCSLEVQKRTPRMCFSSEYFRRGLTKCRQKQTADDLLLIASSFFLSLALSLSVPHSLCSFSQASPLFLSLSSSSLSHHSFFFFSPPSLTVYHTLPSSLLQRCFKCLSLSSPGFLHLLPPVCPFIPLIGSCASSPFPYPFLSFTPSLSTVLYSACLPACRSIP